MCLIVNLQLLIINVITVKIIASYVPSIDCSSLRVFFFLDTLLHRAILSSQQN